MEVYVLDEVLRRETVVDTFESMIWTERFSAYGEFEMVIHSSNYSRQTLAEGKRLAINESHRVMVVETIENKDDTEGKSLLTIRGKSLEAILLDRANRKKFPATGNVAPDKWTPTYKPAEIARLIFNTLCVNNEFFPGDNIPFLVDNVTLYPANTIPEPADIVTVELKITNVYESIKTVCDAFNLGFRLYRNFDKSQLIFEVYSGSERTTYQNLMPPVVFSPALDNLANTSELSSIANYKNVAYVFSSVGVEVVYVDGADEDTAGFDRHVLTVLATDVNEQTDPALVRPILIQRGLEALSEHRRVRGVDGEVPQYSVYKYGIDYHLGDIVELRNADGVTSLMRVTEQIFVSDSQGDRSYPTLAVDQFITPGTWDSWVSNKVWDEAIGEWVDL